MTQLKRDRFSDVFEDNFEPIDDDILDGIEFTDIVKTDELEGFLSLLNGGEEPNGEDLAANAALFT